MMVALVEVVIEVCIITESRTLNILLRVLLVVHGFTQVMLLRVLAKCEDGILRLGSLITRHHLLVFVDGLLQLLLELRYFLIVTFTLLAQLNVALLQHLHLTIANCLFLVKRLFDLLHLRDCHGQLSSFLIERRPKSSNFLLHEHLFSLNVFFTLLARLDLLLQIIELLLQALNVKFHLLLALYVSPAFSLELPQDLLVFTVSHGNGHVACFVARAFLFDVMYFTIVLHVVIVFSLVWL